MPLLSAPNFVNVKQEKTNWCWAAVAANVYNSLGPPAPVTQCDVVKMVEGPAACGQNSQDTLSSALSALGISDERMAKPHLALVVDEFEGVADAVDLDENGVAEPVCAELSFPGDAFHFVAITEVDTDNQKVWVADPFVGGPAVPFDYQEFIQCYQFTKNGPIGTVQHFARVVNIFAKKGA